MNNSQIDSKLFSLKFLKHIYKSPIDYNNAMYDVWDAVDLDTALARIIREFSQKEKIEAMLVDLLFLAWEDIKQELSLNYKDFFKSYPDVIGEWTMEKQEREELCKKTSNCF
jgi:hypothetical protein